MPFALPAYSFVSKEFMHYHAYVTGMYLPHGPDNLSAVPMGFSSAYAFMHTRNCVQIPACQRNRWDSTA